MSSKLCNLVVTDEPRKFVKKNIGKVDVDAKKTGSPGQTQHRM